MTDYIFAPAPLTGLPIIDSDQYYAVNRIFCVGRNYADHAREMGAEVEKDEPFFFTKPAGSLVISGVEISYPPGTQNLHYEMEMVVALGREVFEADCQQARASIFALACGLDLTRRDLQARLKQKSHPWDLAKAFENSAVVSALNTTLDFDSLPDREIELRQNGKTRQQAKIGDMVWRIEKLIVFLSRYYHLKPGDLIFSGTPAGVGPISCGDRLEGSIEGVGSIQLSIR